MTSVRKVPRVLRRRVHEFRSRLRGDSGDIPSHISCCPRLPLRETLLTAGGGFSTGRWTLGSRLLSQKLRLVHTESEDPHGPVTSLVLKEQLRIIVPHSPGVEQKGCFNLILTVPNFCHLRIWRQCHQNTVGCECQLKIKYFRERMDRAREKAFSPNSETTEETPETQEKKRGSQAGPGRGRQSWGHTASRRLSRADASRSGLRPPWAQTT